MRLKVWLFAYAIFTCDELPSAPKTRRKAEDAQEPQQHDTVDQVMGVLIACVPDQRLTFCLRRPLIRRPTRCAVGAAVVTFSGLGTLSVGFRLKKKTKNGST